MTRRTTVAAAVCAGALAVTGLAGCSSSSPGVTLPADSGGASAASAQPTRIAFTDPEKAYTLEISSAWSRATAPGAGIEAWAVAAPKDGFAANVNVLTQQAAGLDLQSYLDASLANMGTAKVIKSELVAEDGRRLGLLEYSQTMTAGGAERPLHFLASFDVADGHAVVATLTTTEPTFAAVRKTVEPYLRTLRASAA